jgi:hypothetical protein
MLRIHSTVQHGTNFEKHNRYGENFREPLANSTGSHHVQLEQIFVFFATILRTIVARQLASRFGGDRGSCDWRHFGRLAGFTNQKKERRLENGLQPFVKLRCAEGRVYSRAPDFLREVEALKRALLSQRELRKSTQPRGTDAFVRSLASFHTDPRYSGDLHRADIAWALHAAARDLSREQIEHEILNGRDLSKKGPRPHQFDYAARTARKAISSSTA